ncbi:anti-sigma-F factor Fin family protein [Lihuaxuella thermophila]|uniref:Uncharacterized protein n=1 Tax=Lihuaxuella thermophila TaxID=1173111 RepID=A0A1H8I761_9BACL|nr:anti-sigma-F factor Fin family protein [Lihuaxuella thermophila]SEN64102.1 Protein of unknown function [Lihuaxuella thermophila]
MAIDYICRYCNAFLGKLEGDGLTDQDLGFDQLTPEERKDIITSDANGNTRVRVVCESCQEMLDNNPDLSLYPYLFH